MTVRHLKTDVFVLFSLNYIGYHQYFVFQFFFSSIHAISLTVQISLCSPGY